MTTYRNGIGFIGMTLVCLLGIGSCDYDDGSPVVEVARPPVTEKHRPTDCRHLYEAGNTDLDSPWKTCMGVGPKG